MKRWLVLLLIGSGVLSGCETPGRSYVETQLVETLEVEIMPNESKMFTYRLRLPEPSPNQPGGAHGGGHPGGPGGPHGGVKIGRDTHERLLANAAYVTEHSGYCREGFFELDRRVSPFHLWIRGECKDGATAADQQAFGAKKTLTPEHWRKSS